MRSSRKLLLAVLGVVTSLFVVLLAVPALFSSRIESRLKREIARSVNARVDWRRARLSVLADFPNATLALDGLSVVGAGPFAGQPLATADRVRLALDLGSVVRAIRGGDRIVVREVRLVRPVVHLRVLQDGTANWNIARASTGAASGSSPVGVTLRELSIEDGAVTLDDRQSNLEASLSGLTQSLRGDFAQDRAVLASRTRADSASLRFGGVPYLSRVALELNTDVDADLRKHRFAFRNDLLRLNNLRFALSGTVAALDTNVAIDVAFSSPSTAFADILSLVPAIHAHDFARLQTSGRMSVSGRVRGAYGPGAFPAFALRARVDGGSFRYPDLPLPARDISLDLAVENPGGHADSTVVSVKRFHALLGQQPIDASLVMRSPVSDPDVDLRLRGRLELADLARTVKLADVQKLSGSVAADVALRARMSQLDAGAYDRVAASGTIGVARVAVRATSLPHAVAIDTAALRLTPRRAELTAFAGRVGRSDVRGTASLDNLLAFLLRGDELRGQASLSSEHFDLDEWRSDDETLEVIPVPANVDFAVQAAAAKVKYGSLTAADVRGGLRVKNRRVTLEELRMETMRGSVVARGFYDTTVPARPTFDIGLHVASVDVPTAFAALATVQKLAPVARWARGAVSGDFAVRGALGRDMTPLTDVLTGRGSVESDGLQLDGVPVLAKLAQSFALEQLRNPTLRKLRATFEIVDGRLHVTPFTVRLAQTDVTVAGSNGVDQSLDYSLALAVPRSEVDAAAGQTIARLASSAGKAGLDLAAAEVVQLGARVTGSMTDPTVKPNFAGVASSARDVARQAVETRVAALEKQRDSAAEDGRRRARAEAERLTAEAERQAATVREEARSLAAKVRQEGNARADTLVARATTPAARLAAKVGADRIRREADAQADRLVREADSRADGVVTQAKRQADALVAPGA